MIEFDDILMKNISIHSYNTTPLINKIIREGNEIIIVRFVSKQPRSSNFHPCRLTITKENEGESNRYIFFRELEIFQVEKARGSSQGSSGSSTGGERRVGLERKQGRNGGGGTITQVDESEVRRAPRAPPSSGLVTYLPTYPND